MDLAFILCTEPPIEKQSRFLVRSIRKWVDDKIPIYSFSPKGKDISPETEEDFIRLDVQHEKCTINTSYNAYNANKPFVAAYAEEKNLAKVLVFLDSDTLILDYPDHILEQDYEVAATPEELINIGISNLKTGQEAEFWNTLYNFTGKFPTRMTKTIADEAYTYEYFNSGLVAIKTNKGIFSYWKEIYKYFEDNKISPKSGNHFVEQACLAAAITALADNVMILPRTYNYPISWHPTLILPRRIQKLEDVVSVHYHRFLGDNWRNDINEQLIGINTKTEKFKWMTSNLEELYS